MRDWNGSNLIEFLHFKNTSRRILLTMSISLEAREILNHLNNLGYRNITSAQLKEFMAGKATESFHSSILLNNVISDLKRLIKYEARFSNTTSLPSRPEQNESEMVNIFDKLHISLTAATRAKTVKPTAKERVTNENIPPVGACKCPKQSQSKITANSKKQQTVVLETSKRQEQVSQPDSKCMFFSN